MTGSIGMPTLQTFSQSVQVFTHKLVKLNCINYITGMSYKSAYLRCLNDSYGQSKTFKHYK